MPEWIVPTLIGLGVSLLGLMYREVRGLRDDLGKFSNRLAHIEGRLAVDQKEAA